MPIQNEREFNRYSIALFDFTKARDFLTEVRNYPPTGLPFQALLFAAIICYYRPFSANEKSDSSPAISRLRIDEFGTLSPSEIEIHEQCKKLRNEALAHSGYRHNPTHIDPHSKVIVSRPFWLSSVSIDIEGLMKLLDKFITVCHHKRADYKLHGLV
jgi:hypothetical protein